MLIPLNFFFFLKVLSFFIKFHVEICSVATLEALYYILAEGEENGRSIRLPDLFDGDFDSLTFFSVKAFGKEVECLKSMPVSPKVMCQVSAVF